MTTAIYNFVAEDFNTVAWLEEPTRQNTEDLRPYFDDYVRDCIARGRKIPKGLNIENYVEAWNSMLNDRARSAAHC